MSISRQIRDDEQFARCIQRYGSSNDEQLARSIAEEQGIAHAVPLSRRRSPGPPSFDAAINYPRAPPEDITFLRNIPDVDQPPSVVRTRRRQPIRQPRNIPRGRVVRIIRNNPPTGPPANIPRARFVRVVRGQPVRQRTRRRGNTFGQGTRDVFNYLLRNADQTATRHIIGAITGMGTGYSRGGYKRTKYRGRTKGRNKNRKK